MAPARVPDFATLASEAIEAAEVYMEHMEHCRECAEGPLCLNSVGMKSGYHVRRDRALKAIRAKGSKTSVASDNDKIIRRGKK